MLHKMRVLINTYRCHRQSTCGYGVRFSADAKCISQNISNINIGDESEICARLYSLDNGIINIGKHSTIRYGSKVSCIYNISIGSYVIISNNVTIYDHNSHPTDPRMRKRMCEIGFYGDAWHAREAANGAVCINDNVWIGEHSTVLKGVTIGEGSVIACRSVVTKDVPSYTIVGGNPARVVKSLV